MPGPRGLRAALEAIATRCRRAGALSLLACLFLFPAAKHALPADKVTIAVGEWAPYFSESAPGYGTYAQVVTYAFAQEGVEVQYGFFPWKRSLQLVKTGDWDASAGWGITEERLPFYHFCDPVLVQREVPFYSAKNPLTVDSFSTAGEMTFGALLGAALGAELEGLIEKGTLKVFRASTFDKLFRMLSAGRLDFVIGNEFAAREAIEEVIPAGEQQFFRPRYDLAVVWEYRVIVSRKHPDGEGLCTTFNQGLQKAKDDGTFERIMGEDAPTE